MRLLARTCSGLLLVIGFLYWTNQAIAKPTSTPNIIITDYDGTLMPEHLYEDSISEGRLVLHRVKHLVSPWSEPVDGSHLEGTDGQDTSAIDCGPETVEVAIWEFEKLKGLLAQNTSGHGYVTGSIDQYFPLKSLLGQKGIIPGYYHVDLNTFYQNYQNRDGVSFQEEINRLLQTKSLGSHLHDPDFAFHLIAKALGENPETAKNIFVWTARGHTAEDMYQGIKKLTPKFLPTPLPKANFRLFGQQNYASTALGSDVNQRKIETYRQAIVEASHFHFPDSVHPNRHPADPKKAFKRPTLSFFDNHINEVDYTKSTIYRAITLAKKMLHTKQVQYRVKLVFGFFGPEEYLEKFGFPNGSRIVVMRPDGSFRPAVDTEIYGELIPPTEHLQEQVPNICRSN